MRETFSVAKPEAEPVEPFAKGEQDHLELEGEFVEVPVEEAEIDYTVKTAGETAEKESGVVVEAKLRDLKAQIEQINTEVRLNILDTAVADQKVEELIAEIHALEEIKNGGVNSVETKSKNIQSENEVGADTVESFSEPEQNENYSNLKNWHEKMGIEEPVTDVENLAEDETAEVGQSEELSDFSEGAGFSEEAISGFAEKPEANDDLYGETEKEEGVKTWHEKMRVGEVSEDYSKRADAEPSNMSEFLSNKMPAEADLSAGPEVELQPVAEEVDQVAGEKEVAPAGAEMAEDTPEDKEKKLERGKYLQLKRDFRATQKEYYQDLEKNYQEKGVGGRILGKVKDFFGQGSEDELSHESRMIYDKYMACNERLFEYSQTSDTFAEITRRLKVAQEKAQKKAQNEKVSAQESSQEDKSLEVGSINMAVADRHVLRPAQQRLELQSAHLPEGVKAVKEKLMNWGAGKIEGHEKLVAGLAEVVGVVLLVRKTTWGLPAYLSSRAANYMGDKLFNDRAENRVKADKLDASETFAEALSSDETESLNLEELDDKYFATLKHAQNVKNRVRAGVLGATLGGGLGGAAAGYDIGDLARSVGGASETVADSVAEFIPEGAVEATKESFTDIINEAQEAVDEVINTTQSAVEGVSEEISEVAEEGAPDLELIQSYDIEKTFAKGNNLSRVLVDSIKEKVAEGTFKLPVGVEATDAGIAQYVYKVFPEMTDATEGAARMSEDYWRDIVGIESGVPHLIKAGETVQVGKLLEALNDVNQYQTVGPGVFETTAPPAAVNPEAVASSGVIEDIKLDPRPSLDHYLEAQPLQTLSDLPETSLEQRTDLDHFLVDAEITLAPVSELSPFITPEYQQMTEEFSGTSQGEMHQKLSETLWRGYQDKTIKLPDTVMAILDRNPAGAYRLVEKYLPEVSESLFDWGKEALSEDYWRDIVGIESGDPKDIAPGETVQMGKLLQYLAEKINQADLQAESLGDMTDLVLRNHDGVLSEEIKDRVVEHFVAPTVEDNGLFQTITVGGKISSETVMNPDGTRTTTNSFKKY